MYAIPDSIAQLEAIYGRVEDLWNVDKMGKTIVGPRDLIRLERLRESVFSSVGQFETIPARCFVFALGEPESAYVTKVGGRPYRRWDQPWPASGGGQPLKFIAQFVFEPEERRHFHLPGDVLCVFADSLRIGSHTSQMICEWHMRAEYFTGESIDSGVPPAECVKCWGRPFITADLVGGETKEIALQAAMQLLDAADCARVNDIANWLCIVRGVKIGGLPFWTGEGAVVNDDRRLLCTLATIVPTPEDQWPWLNYSAEMSFAEVYAPDMRLDIRDGFAIHFFISAQGEVDHDVVFV